MLAPTIVIIFLTTTVLSALSSTNIEKTCEEISKFILNVCHHEAFQAKCKQKCLQGTYQLRCGTRLTYSLRKRPVMSVSDLAPWPWHVSLQWKGNHTCGAWILSPHYIITAAHCLDTQYTSRDPGDFTLLVGSTQQAPHGHSLRVHSFMTHPGYSALQRTRKDLPSSFVEDNLSIIRLKDKLELGYGNRDSVCLPDLLNPLSWKYHCFMIGYNVMEFMWKNIILNNPADHLSHSPIETIPMGKCNYPEAFNKTLEKAVTVCAGIGSFNLRKSDFDSGGGLVCEHDDRWYLRGITASSGFICGENISDAIFTNVAHYEDWIITSIFELQDVDAKVGSRPKILLAVASFFLLCISTVGSVYAKLTYYEDYE